MNKRLKIVLISIALLFGVGFFQPFAINSAVYAGKCGEADTNVIDCKDDNIDNTTVENNAIIVLLKKVIKWLSGLVGVVAVVMIMVAGAIYATAGDKDEQVNKAKTMMQNTIIGVVLYVFMTLVLNFLVPGGIL